MAIRKFTCGHTRTVQPYKQAVVHKINSDCPACSAEKMKVIHVLSVRELRTRTILTGKVWAPKKK